MHPRLLVMPLLLLALAACSSAPQVIRRAPPGDLSYKAVRHDISAYAQAPVRWGGTIVSVENEQDASWVQILQLPLGRQGRPNVRGTSEGRFMLRTSDFLDPAIYTEGLELTVYGQLDGEVERQVGHRSLRMPLVDAQVVHLWESYRSDPGRPYFYPSAYGAYGFPRSRFGFGIGLGFRRRLR